MFNHPKIRHQRTLFGFGTVALADILANSVVVILLLIVITLKIKEEQIATQRQQSHDINVLLSRQIATSVVMNDLPSSRPALLHDYTSCRIPHDCNPALYPIIELHPNMMREYNSGLTLSREQLLEPTNQLDSYLVQLDADNKRNIRIDVYGVELFYLVLDILKQHDINVYHWHFLGEDSPVPQVLANSWLQTIRGQQIDENLSAAGELVPGLSANNGEQQNDQQSTNSPADVSLRDPGLWRDSLLPPPWQRQSGAEEQINSELLDGGANSSEQERIAAMTAELLGAMEDLQQQNQQPSFQIRLPFTDPEGGEANGDMSELKLDRLLLALLIYLDSAEQSGLSNIRPQAIMQFALSHPEPQSLPQYARAQQIVANLSERRPEADELISFIRQNDTIDASEPVLLVDIDKPLQQATLREHALIPAQTAIGADGSGKLSLGLRLYPFIDQAERQDLLANSIVLTPSKHRQQYQWLPVLLLDAQLQNNIIGYVYGKNESGRLELATKSNDVRINSVPIVSVTPTNPGRSNLALLAIYAALLLAVLLGLFIWQRSRQRLAPGRAGFPAGIGDARRASPQKASGQNAGTPGNAAVSRPPCKSQRPNAHR